MQPPDPQIVQTVITKLQQEYPNSKTSLDFATPFQLLISTMLSAQTTDKAVNKATPALFANYPTSEKMATATVDEIKQYIKSIGLYNTKAKNLQKTAQQLVELHNGQVPKTMKELIALPGVGRKTANVVLGNGFGIMDSGITIDTHMIRIMNLLGWADGKNAEKIEKHLMTFIPVEYWVNITHLIINHGRKICIANKPKCDQCVLASECPSSLV